MRSRAKAELATSDDVRLVPYAHILFGHCASDIERRGIRVLLRFRNGDEHNELVHDELSKNFQATI